MFLEGHVQEAFNSTVDIMINMEDISTGAAKKYYQYRVNSIDEMKVQAEEVTREYKSGMMDPSRDAAIYEKMNAVKKKACPLLSGLREYYQGYLTYKPGFVLPRSLVAPDQTPINSP